MNCYIIDAKKREVREAEFPASGVVEFIQEIVGGYFDIARLGNEDAVYVDDEGLINGTQEFFWLPWYPHPLAGSGVYVGPADDEGNDTEPRQTFESVKRLTKFMTREEVAALVRR